MQTTLLRNALRHGHIRFASPRRCDNQMVPAAAKGAGTLQGVRERRLAAVRAQRAAAAVAARE